jgi:dTDP-3-amino-3,4,6-trideoxy-alpha-D-glucose transaminase
VSEVPLVDLKAQYRTIEDEIAAALERVLSCQVFINGPETIAFEQEFASACEASECVAVSSGTTALELALKALGVGRGDEVITVSHTFFATVEAIVATGATPVLVDIDPHSWTMAPESVADSLSPRTKAIVPVHIYGHPADVPAIASAAPDVPIVEDAAQAHLARYYDGTVGWCAQAACYSFYPGKNLGAYGDAGAIVTSDPQLAMRMRALRDHGRMKGAKYEHELLGTNARAAELQMAVLRAKLPHLGSWTRERQRLSARYEQELSGRLGLQIVRQWAEHARHLFVILHPARDDLLSALRKRGIGAAIHYPVPCHRQAAIEGIRRWPSVRLEVTERVARTCLTLPLYAELGDEGLDYVVDALRPLLTAMAA